MILRLVLCVAFPGVFSAVACGIIYLSFFYGQVAALEQNRAAQFLGGFLLPDFGEQLQHSGSARSDQPGITLCLYSWKLWQCITAAPRLQDAQLGILGDQKMVIKIKKGVESKDLHRNAGAVVYLESSASLGTTFLDLNLCCGRPDLVFFTILQ